MMPCPHYGCNFRNENGYCKVTTCANPDYNGMTIRVANTIKVAPKTNADRIRAMSDEELASKFADIYCPDGLSVNHERCKQNYLKGQPIEVCEECWLEWLKQECEN